MIRNAARQAGFEYTDITADQDREDLEFTTWLKFKLQLMKEAASGKSIAVIITPPTESFQTDIYRDHEGQGRYGKKDVDPLFKDNVRRENLYMERSADLFEHCISRAVPVIFYTPWLYDEIDDMPKTDPLIKILKLGRTSSRTVPIYLTTGNVVIHQPPHCQGHWLRDANSRGRLHPAP